MKKTYLKPSITLTEVMAAQTFLAGSTIVYKVKDEDYDDETMTDLSRNSYSLWDDEE